MNKEPSLEHRAASSSHLRHRGSTTTRPNIAMSRINAQKKAWFFHHQKAWVRVLLLVILVVMMIAWYRWWFNEIPITHSTTLRHVFSNIHEKEGALSYVSLRDFPYLHQVVQEHSHVQLLALYFAASWCPMSTKPTQLLDELFRDHLLLPNATLVLVYVSSDATQDSFQSYLRPGWQAIPFHNSLERSHLQRYFRTCAKRELKELGIRPEERLHEIPHLYVVSTRTGAVLSSDGLANVRDYGAQTLSYWHGLL